MQRESDLFIASITDRIVLLLPINHKYYNLGDKKNTKVWKGEIYIKSLRCLYSNWNQGWDWLI